MALGDPSGLTILRSTYVYVSTMRLYLDAVVRGVWSMQVPSESTLSRFLDDSLVAADVAPLREMFPPSRPFCTQSEILDRARSKLFTHNNKRFQNILNLGYRMADSRGEAHRGGLSNFFTNTTADLLQTPDWQLLLEQVGEDVMFHMLTTTSIFISLPNDCWCQVAGHPISELSGTSHSNGLHPKLHRHLQEHLGEVPPCDETASARQRRQCTKAKKLSYGIRRRSASEISLLRMRMFYAKAVRSSQGQLVAGLPRVHVLNRLRPGADTKHTARHLLKYIFPCEFGLTNVFRFERGSGTAFEFPDYTVREAEIREQDRRKTPKRISNLFHVATRLLQQHRSCDYWRVCNALCPSKVHGKAELSDSSTILDILSEVTQQSTQNEPPTKYASLPNIVGGVGVRTTLCGRPRFAEFTCSHNEVFRFVSAVTIHVIPRSFWGSERNLRTVLQGVKRLIRARRYETCSLHELMDGFSTVDCDWLAPNTVGERRLCASDTMKRRHLIEEFLYWFYDSFLLTLLKTTFYITDSSAYRNRILYFRQDDWEFLCRPLLDHLASTNFVHLAKDDVEELMPGRQLGFSSIRLLPKETGVRPIVNLRRRTAHALIEKNGSKIPDKGMAMRSQSAMSINQILQAAFQVLTLEKARQPDLLGGSVLGLNEIYEKLKVFKRSLAMHEPTGVPLYFVKVDVRACFDSIEQEKLLSILDRVIVEDGYLVQKYAQVVPTAGKLKRSFVRRACPDSEHPSFITVASKLAASLRHAIFVDQVVYPSEDRHQILQLLREHVTENIIKIGDDFYRQTIGIPQGSVLSTILCSFFYGDLEKCKLAFIRNATSLLLRFVDDFLFITADKSHALRFIETMNDGHPEYGCFISGEKTRANFDYHNSNGSLVSASRDQEFQWCGLSINTRSLSVKADYSRYKETHMADTLSVDTTRKAGLAFRFKLFQAVKQRSHILFNDTSLNSIHDVYVNVYQNFLISAMKMHAYIRAWRADVSLHDTFLLEAIRESIQFAHFATRNKSRAKLALDNDACCQLRPKFIRWLGLFAFRRVLSKRRACYERVLFALTCEMADPKMRRGTSRLAAVIREGDGVLAAVAF